MNATDKLQDKTHRPSLTAEWRVTRTASFLSLLFVGVLMQGVRSNPIQISDDTDIKYGDLDVAPTAEGWFGIWGGTKGTDFLIKGRRINVNGEVIGSQAESIYFSAMRERSPSVDCQADQCLLAWRGTKEIFVRTAQLLSSGLRFTTSTNSSDPRASLIGRLSVACSSISSCTVAASWNEKGTFYARTQNYNFGAPVGGEVRITDSALDPSSGVQLSNYGQGQIWIYSSADNNGVMVRTRPSETGELGDELLISEQQNSPPHWPRLDCLPTGVCATGWLEQNSVLQPRWRLFDSNGTMLTGVLSDIQDAVPDSFSVGIALTDTLQFRAWQKMNGTKTQLMYQWIDFKGLPVSNPLLVVDDLLNVDAKFVVESRLNQAMVVWTMNKGGSNSVLGRLFSPPGVGVQTTSVPKTTVSLAPTAPTILPLTTLSSTLSMTSTEPDTVVFVTSSLTLPIVSATTRSGIAVLSTSKAPAITVAQTSTLPLSSVLVKTFERVLSSPASISTANAARETSTPAILNHQTTGAAEYSRSLNVAPSASSSANITETSSPNFDADKKSPTLQQGSTPDASSDHTTLMIVGIVSAIACSIFAGLMGALGYYRGHKSRKNDGSKSEFESLPTERPSIPLELPIIFSKSESPRSSLSRESSDSILARSKSAPGRVDNEYGKIEMDTIEEAEYDIVPSLREEQEAGDCGLSPRGDYGVLQDSPYLEAQIPLSASAKKRQDRGYDTPHATKLSKSTKRTDLVRVLDTDKIRQSGDYDNYKSDKHSGYNEAKLALPSEEDSE